MNIKINSVHFHASDTLEDFVENKIKKLTKHHDEVLAAEVFLRLEKDESKENKVSEIKLDIPGGGDFFAKKQAKTFEEATDLSIDALRRQLQKRKEKVRGV